MAGRQNWTGSPSRSRRHHDCNPTWGAADSHGRHHSYDSTGLGHTAHAQNRVGVILRYKIIWNIFIFLSLFFYYYFLNSTYHEMKTKTNKIIKIIFKYRFGWRVMRMIYHPGLHVMKYSDGTIWFPPNRVTRLPKANEHRAAKPKAVSRSGNTVQHYQPAQQIPGRHEGEHESF